MAGDMGLRAIVLPKDSLELGIETARALLSVCYVDAKNCAPLVRALENYSRKFNEKMQVYSESPHHTWASHYADAFRYAAMALKMYGKSATSLTPSMIQEMRLKHLGY